MKIKVSKNSFLSRYENISLMLLICLSAYIPLLAFGIIFVLSLTMSIIFGDYFFFRNLLFIFDRFLIFETFFVVGFIGFIFQKHFPNFLKIEIK